MLSILIACLRIMYGDYREKYIVDYFRELMVQQNHNGKWV